MNWLNIVFKKSVEQIGFEPISSDLQSGALTNFSTVPFGCNPGLEPYSSRSQWDALPDKLETPY